MFCTTSERSGRVMSGFAGLCLMLQVTDKWQDNFRVCSIAFDNMGERYMAGYCQVCGLCSELQVRDMER